MLICSRLACWLPSAGLLGLIAVVPAFGQTETLGAEFEVNTYTTGDQAYPSVAKFVDGSFVVVWDSSGSSDSDSSSLSVHGRLYAADGSAIGAGFQVNTYTTYAQRNPSVAASPDGSFVVVWESGGSTGTDDSPICTPPCSGAYSVQARRYASTGSPNGDEFQVNTYTTDNQSVPTVATDAAADFVVAWRSRGSSGTDSSNFSIQGQRYASSGSPLGGEFQVNTYTSSTQSLPAVAMGPAGDSVFVWQSSGSSDLDNSGTSILGQRFASDGSPVGGEFQVNTFVTGGQVRPAVAKNGDADFVAVWQSAGSSGSDDSASSVQGQRLAADGSRIGGEFQANTYTTADQYHPAVASHAAGEFIVVWQSLGSSGSDASLGSIQAQRYDAAGSPIGGEFQVNTYTTLNQRYPSVATDLAGDFVVAWESNGSSGNDTSPYSIQGQRYRVLLFADGFESGNTTAWSAVVP